MLTIQQDALKTALNAVTRASLKSSLAAFALVRLDAGTDGVLRLSCFNGETAARANANAACEEPLSVSVDALTLKAVVETLASEIHLMVEGNSLVIQSSVNRTTLRIVDEPIPVIGEESTRTIATLSGTIFRSLSRALPFASTDGSRAILQVLHLTLEQDAITAQAADGFSAGHVREDIVGPVEKKRVSLPLSFARLLSVLVEERDSVHICSAGDNRFLFRITNLEDAKVLTLATVAGADGFPSEQILALIEEARTSTSAHLHVQQASLAQSIRMVNAMGTQTTFLKAVNGIAKIASAETETGQARNILEGTASGQDAHVWLSAAYLKHAADACKGEIVLRISDAKKPVLIEGGCFTAVIMPMLVEGSKDPFPNDEAVAISLPDLLMV